MISATTACLSSKEIIVESDFANEDFIKVTVQFDPDQQTPCDYLLRGAKNSSILKLLNFNCI